MRALLLFTLLLASWGCKTTKEVPTPEPGTEMYQEAAEAAFERAQSSMDRRDYSIAVERFESVRNRYPHSPYAALAELRVADALFALDRNLEAADAYGAFVSRRPAHPEAHYAAFRQGVALERQAPSDLWIMPPAHEKDLTHVRDVADVLRRFLGDYPESEHVEEARELLNEVLTRLASHELYVADFYRKRDRWQAVVFRLETVLREYSGLGFDIDAKIGLAEAYMKLEEPKLEEAGALLEEVRVLDDIEPEDLERARTLQEELDRMMTTEEVTAGS